MSTLKNNFCAGNHKFNIKTLCRQILQESAWRPEVGFGLHTLVRAHLRVFYDKDRRTKKRIMYSLSH